MGACPWPRDRQSQLSLLLKAKPVTILVGSTPGDNKNINGVLLFESSRALFKSITGGSINVEPSSLEIKFDIANDNRSNLKHLTNNIF